MDFTFRPALLVRPQTVVLDDDHVVVREADGTERWRLAWRDISEAAFVQYSLRSSRMKRLDMMVRDASGKRQKRTVSCTSTYSEVEPNYRAFRDAVSAIAKRLAERDPDLPVIIGEYGRARFAVFIVGVLCLVGSVGMTLAAFFTGRGERALTNAAVPLVFLLLFGLTLSWRAAPWRAMPRVPVSLFARAFDATDEEGET